MLTEEFKSNSQAGQDVFVYSVCKRKLNGWFLEIGSNHPKCDNNTYILEKELNWKGIMVEYSDNFKYLYDAMRLNSKYIIKDAREINYLKEFQDMKFPKVVDYLQIDLEVDNRSTLDTLEILDKQLFDHYEFSTVTFEHDIYRGDYFDTRKKSREIFKKRGYELVFPDVKVVCGGIQEFEDWYVHPNHVDMEMIEQMRRPDPILGTDISYIVQSLRKSR